uniref:Nuclear receptor subfamily 1 group I member 3 n=1 Tax=Chelonoidis abingdonii TaxID=106734 RepID=A0A8C0QRH0_CHEAB
MLSPSDRESSSSSSSSPSVLSLGAGSREDWEPEGEEKICAVCGDRATGYHFHVMTCEGCKGFFRRSISKGVCFTCPFTRNCTVTKAKRRQCQACRLQKCLAVGMRKDMIMSEEALQMRRVLRKRKQQEREPAGEPAELTEEQEQIISILLEAHKRHFDSGFSQFAHCRPPVRLYIHSLSPQNPQEPRSLPGDMLPDIFSMLPHFADLSTVLIQQVIKFAKEIPAFRSLPIDDQISLLKGATLEICQIQFNTVFNEETKAWECGQHCYTIQDGALGKSLWRKGLAQLPHVLSTSSPRCPPTEAPTARTRGVLEGNMGCPAQNPLTRTVASPAPRRSAMPLSRAGSGPQCTKCEKHQTRDLRKTPHLLAKTPVLTLLTFPGLRPSSPWLSEFLSAEDNNMNNDISLGNQHQPQLVT